MLSVKGNLFVSVMGFKKDGVRDVCRGPTGIDGGQFVVWLDWLETWGLRFRVGSRLDELWCVNPLWFL